MTPNLIAKLALSSFFFFVVLYGAWAAGIVLREPDICFLLAGGRDIVEHGRLPYLDPFAYTLVKEPVIVQQWLTEVIFYSFYKFSTGVGLLVLDAAILCLTFVVIPFRICRLHGVSPGQSLGIAVLAALSSFSHTSVRPEIFSCLLIGCFLELLSRVDGHENRGAGINWRFVAAFSVLMILWVNLHSLFIAGPLLIGFYLVCRLIEKFVFKLEAPINPTIYAAFVACLLAIVINPYGIKLITFLGTFFLPYAGGTLKLRSNEMAPITLTSFKNPMFYGFFALSALGLIRLCKQGLRKPQRAGDLFFKLIIPGGIIAGFKTMRTIPISALLVAAGTASIGARAKTATSEKPADKSNENTIDFHLDQVCKFSGLFAATCMGLAGLGAYLMTCIIPPEFPEGSAAFNPPFKAIEFIGTAKPAGKVLNDPHFGDVMMWQLQSAPQLFFDSRYYLYGQDLIDEYWTMVLCQDKWQSLMDHYGFDWVFIPSNLKLAEVLSHDPGWKVLYSDNGSVVIARIKDQSGATVTSPPRSQQKQ